MTVEAVNQGTDKLLLEAVSESHDELPEILPELMADSESQMTECACLNVG